MSNSIKFNCPTPAPAPKQHVTIVEGPVKKTDESLYPSIKAYNDKFPNRPYWRPAMDVYNSDGVVIGRDT